MNENKNLFHNVLPIVLMGGLFVVIHFLALLLVWPFDTAGMQAFEQV